MTSTLSAIELAFSKVSLTTVWAEFCGHWTDGTADAMGFLTMLLRPLQPRQPIDAATLKELIDEMSALEEMTRTAEIDPQLRILILDHTTAIRRAMNAYSIGGADYLERTVTHAIGSIGMYSELFKHAGPGGRFQQFLIRARLVVRTAKVAAALLTAGGDMREGFDKLLGN